MFGSRLSLVAHLSDFRLRSKTRNTNCAWQFRESNPVKIDSELLGKLRDDNRVARKEAYDVGRSHPVVDRLAVRGRKSCLKAIPSRLLPYVCPHGSRRRATYKKPECVANLKLKNTPERELRLQGIGKSIFRVPTKSRPEYLFLKTPLRNVNATS